MTQPTIIRGTRAKVYVQQSGTGAVAEAHERSAQIKEISQSGGARAFEVIRTLNDNEVTRELEQEMMEVELSVLHTDPRLFEAVAGGSDAVTRYDAGSYPMIVAGDDDRIPHRVWIEASGAAADDWKARMLWNDAFGVSSELSVDAEGYMEETTRFSCLAEDYTYEWTGSYTTAPISTLANF